MRRHCGFNLLQANDSSLNGSVSLHRRAGSPPREGRQDKPVQQRRTCPPWQTQQEVLTLFTLILTTVEGFPEHDPLQTHHGGGPADHELLLQSSFSFRFKMLSLTANGSFCTVNSFLHIFTGRSIPLIYISASLEGDYGWRGNPCCQLLTYVYEKKWKVHFFIKYSKCLKVSPSDWNSAVSLSDCLCKKHFLFSSLRPQCLCFSHLQRIINLWCGIIRAQKTNVIIHTGKQEDLDVFLNKGLLRNEISQTL